MRNIAEGIQPELPEKKKSDRKPILPEEFKLPSSNVKAYQQFGNSVAVPVVKKVSEQVVEQILEV